MGRKTKSIPIANLSLNTENPRFELVGSQRDAVKIMIEDQGDKLLNLAKDIVNDGLNPGDIPFVTPDELEKGKYKVLEGNRRVTALKILHNPSLIDSSLVSFAKRINPLIDQFKKEPLDEVPCVVFDTPEEANKWIKLKHTGENDGVGIVKWDPVNIARFDERNDGVAGIALQAIDFLSREQSVPDAVKENLKNVPTSSLKRLLTDTNIQEVIGISIVDNKLQTDLQKSEVVKGLVKITMDLATKKIRVRDIYKVKDREKYIETFKPSEIPNKKKRAENTWELNSPISDAIAEKKKKKKPLKPAPLSTDRKTIIRKDCIISINDSRINKIYSELKSIEVDDFENAAGVLLRVFIELSLDAYIEHNALTTVTIDATLRKKVDEVSLDMERDKRVNKHICKGIRIAVNKPQDILSMDTFNAYVHNRHFSPNPKDLKHTWDNIHIFVEKIWENIN